MPASPAVASYTAGIAALRLIQSFVVCPRLKCSHAAESYRAVFHSVVFPALHVSRNTAHASVLGIPDNCRDVSVCVALVFPITNTTDTMLMWSHFALSDFLDFLVFFVSYIEIDISNLHLRQSIKVGEAVVPDEVKLVSDPEAILVHIEVPAKEEEIEVEEEEEELIGEEEEPEVIGKEKPEGEEKEEEKKEDKSIEKKVTPLKKLTEIQGIGPSVVKKFEKAKIKSIEELFEMDVDDLASINGIGGKTAENIVKNLKKLIEGVI